MENKMDPKMKKRLKDAYESPAVYKDFVYYGQKKYFLPDNKALIDGVRTFEVREDDVWIGGFPRSGTRWMAEQTWLICNNLDYDKALTVPHIERIWYFDYNFKVIGSDPKCITYTSHKIVFGEAPSPRYFKTHLPLSLLPPDLLNKAKMVYIARDPRDVVVSSYHFFRKYKDNSFKKDIKEYWQLFRSNHCMFGPYFENLKEYWAQRNHPNLLFLFYQDIHKDLHGTMRKVAKFFEKSYTDEQFNGLYEHLQFSNMKKNKAVNFNEMLGNHAEEMIRKGVAGGWREEFDEQMTVEAEEWMAENLKDVDFKFTD